MSINSLTNDALLRNMAPTTAAAPPTPVPSNKVNDAASMLIKYVPTESITLYVAAVAATPAFETVAPIGNLQYGPFFYWLGAVLTPLFTFGLYVAKRRSLKLTPAFPGWAKMPLWTMTASTICFVVWALAVPGGLFLQGDNIELKGVIAAFAATFVSTVLSVIESFFGGSGA
jgi:hypothetical protein